MEPGNIQKEGTEAGGDLKGRRDREEVVTKSMSLKATLSFSLFEG